MLNFCEAKLSIIILNHWPFTVRFMRLYFKSYHITHETDGHSGKYIIS
jgi:hypothetical protein